MDDPAWSPDGTEIAFTRTECDEDFNCTYQIAKKSGDGSGDETILADGGSEEVGDPSWGSGGRIAYSSGFPSKDIWTMDATDGANKTNVTDTPSVSEREPDFSPDGSQIAYTSISDDGDRRTSQIFVMGDEGESPINISNIGSALVDDAEPSWSPDGLQIAFRRDDIIEDDFFDPPFYYPIESSIFKMSADGSGKTFVSAGTSSYADSPDWSAIPAGRLLRGGLFISKFADPAPANVGEPLEYSLYVENISEDDTETNVVVEDILPESFDFAPTAEDLTSMGCTYEESSRLLSCNAGDLAPGGFVTYEIVGAPTEEGTLENTATVVSDETPVGDSATTSTDITKAPKTISSEGLLREISITDTLNCQAIHAQDSHMAEFGGGGAFFPGSSPGACGTFIATGGETFGPSTPSAPSFSPYIPVSQSEVTGSGTEEAPFEVTTVVDAGENGMRLEQTDTYVEGEDSYQTDVEITNNSGSEDDITLYRAGDCQLGGGASGFGGHDAETGAVRCLSADFDEESGDLIPGERMIEMVPLTQGSNYYEAFYSDVWDLVAAGTSFPDTVADQDFIDNGMGLSWNAIVPAGESRTISSETRVTGEEPPPPSADLEIDKSADKNPALVGRPLTYDLFVSNNGEVAAQNTIVTNTLPENVAFESARVHLRVFG